MSEARFAASRYARVMQHGVAYYKRLQESFEEKVLVDGHPPFTEKRSPIDQYQTLLSWQATGDPRFYGDPAAQREFVRLAARYGGNPPQPRLPFGQTDYPVGGVMDA